MAPAAAAQHKLTNATTASEERIVALLDVLSCDHGDSCGRLAHHPEETLVQLAQATRHDQGAQSAFVLNNGYAHVLSLISAFPSHVEQVLLAAGTCCASSYTNTDQLCAAPIRVVWPHSVLRHLMQICLQPAQDPVLRTRALALLAYAAQDPAWLHYQAAYDSSMTVKESLAATSAALADAYAEQPAATAACIKRASNTAATTSATPPGGRVQDVLYRMLQELIPRLCGTSTPPPQHSPALPLIGICAVVQLLQCLAAQQQHNASPDALPALFTLYECLHPAPRDHRGLVDPVLSDSPACQHLTQHLQATAGLSTSLPCCSACHILVSMMAAQLQLFPDALMRASQDIGTGSSIDTEKAAQRQGLLQFMIQHIKQLASASPSGVLPVYSWDGQLVEYKTGKQARDPCWAQAAQVPARAHTLPYNPPTPVSPPSTLLAKWLALLGCASTHRSTARAMYRLDVTGVLQQISAGFLDDDWQLTAAVEQVWGWLCFWVPQVMDEVMQESDVHALLGAASHLPAPPGASSVSTAGCGSLGPHLTESQQHKALILALRAVDKLAELVDGCSYAAFMAIVRPMGILSRLYPLLMCAATAQTGGVPTDRSSATAHLRSGHISNTPSARRDRLRKAAHCLMLRCLERAQRTGLLQPSSASKAATCSWFATLDRPSLSALVNLLSHGVSESASAAAALPLAATPSAPPAAVQPSTPATRAARGTAKGGPVGTGNDDSGYDSDGVRQVYSSGPTEEQRAAHSSWLSKDLSDKLTWSQTSDTLDVWLKLPPGTRKSDMSVTITPTRLTVCLSWAGRVLDGPLSRRVKASEAIWVIEGSSERDGAGPAAVCLHIMLPKDELHYWRSLFEGAPERSHIEVLRDAIEADEPIKSWDELEPDARELVEDFRERQWMISQGHLDLENSFDDFRLVVGDNML